MVKSPKAKKIILVIGVIVLLLVASAFVLKKTFTGKVVSDFNSQSNSELSNSIQSNNSQDVIDLTPTGCKYNNPSCDSGQYCLNNKCYGIGGSGGGGDINPVVSPSGY